MPLTWSDITLVQSHDNINFIKDVDGKRYYVMKVNIPAERVGDAILFSRWQRDDVVGEGFYNCADIEIVRDDVEPDTWFDAGFYLKQGQTATVGETVSLRLFNSTGQELINQQLAITETNKITWASDFAQSLNLDYQHLLKIGVKDGQDEINFDVINLLSNVTYVTDQDHTFALAIQPAAINTAPIINDIPSILMDESAEQSIHIYAFDDEQTSLTFTWQVPSEITYTGSDANITLVAPAVDKDTDFNLVVSVSDGLLTTSQSFTVTIKNTPENPTAPAWDSTQVYFAGDKVSYENKVYTAKWWNENQTPDNGSAWALEAATDGGGAVWNAQNEYVKDALVSFQNITYQAKWWTKGEQPDVSDVWQKR